MTDHTITGTATIYDPDEVTKLRAELAKARGALIEIMRMCAGAGCSDRVSTDFLTHLPAEVKACIQNAAASRTKTEHYERVELLHGLIKHPVLNSPAVPDLDRRHLRGNLCVEEVLELVDAMGLQFVVWLNSEMKIAVQLRRRRPSEPKQWGAWELLPCADAAEVSLPHVAKELGDCSVVITGTFASFGIHDRPVLEAVDKNNLDKTGPGHYFRDDGKLIPAPGHKPPDMAVTLKALGWRG